MIFWIDAQLPPGIAGWLSGQFGVEAVAVRDLDLRDASDTEIFEKAPAAQAVMISKDADFVEMVTRRGPPPRLLWVTCGHVTNARLRVLFSALFGDAASHLRAGINIVERADRSVV